MSRKLLQTLLDPQALQAALRAAYQPIYEAQSGDIVAVEALVRLALEYEELIAPAVFLPIAEANGQISMIDAWILEMACRDLPALEAAVGRKLRVNVNVSAQFLESGNFAPAVSTALLLSGTPGTALQIEVTEQQLVQSIPAAARSLNLVKDLGVTIAIDDFGTGYNSLRLLKSFPVECIKIDRDFILDIEDDRYSREICSSVIDLGNNLGMTVIAEGVETALQASFLRNSGCTELQGYHLAYPTVVSKFVGSLSRTAA